MGKRACSLKYCLLDVLCGESPGAVRALLVELRVQAGEVGQFATVHICLVLFVQRDSEDLADRLVGPLLDRLWGMTFRRWQGAWRAINVCIRTGTLSLEIGT